MLVSFIVVTFNEAHAIPLVKKAFDKLILPDGIGVETIAVDGGSRDASVEVARSAGFTQVVELPGANIPVCRNAGIRTAKGDWIAFVDGDCLLDPQWLIHAARLLKVKDQLILGWPASPPTPGTWVQRAWHVHWMNKNPSMEWENEEAVVKHQGFRMITTRNMIMHKIVAERLGGFDETLSTGEDTDFVFRASMANIPAWGLPAMKSIHLGEPETLKKFFRQQVWHANRKAYAVILRKSGMKAGGNAPLFTGLFFLASLTMLASIILCSIHPIYAIGLLPLPLLLIALATRTGIRGKAPDQIPALMMLYAAYGVARSIDLLGFSNRKTSWKKTASCQNNQA